MFWGLRTVSLNISPKNTKIAFIVSWLESHWTFVESFEAEKPAIVGLWGMEDDLPSRMSQKQTTMLLQKKKKKFYS